MRYISTRGGDVADNAAIAIRNGIARDGGLYVPQSIPVFSDVELASLVNADYKRTAFAVFNKFLSGYTRQDIAACIEKAYTGTFDGGQVAPVRALGADTGILELWHGPTSAFKDVALQMLPQLITRAMRITGTGSRIAILVATSGDTGKAALEGFRDVPGTSVTVLFPSDGVSDMQKLQMLTQRGKNVAVLSVKGNFDDAQTAAKAIFADTSFSEKLRERGVLLSSANSINWGRLLPQIVYYVYSSVRQKMLTDYIVPTGNFGNILACWIAKCMGAPIGQLICASNANDVLTDFIKTDVYDRNRCFHKTLSPSMDILISSNLERLVFELCGRDAVQVVNYMDQLRSTGRYEITKAAAERMRTEFRAYAFDDTATLDQIRQTYRRYHYVADPHTAVALCALQEYRKERPQSPVIVVSTASPYKFPQPVYEAIAGCHCELDAPSCLSALSDLTRTPVPRGIAELSGLPRLHSGTCEKCEILSRAEAQILALS